MKTPTEEVYLLARQFLQQLEFLNLPDLCANICHLKDITHLDCYITNNEYSNTLTPPFGIVDVPIISLMEACIRDLR